MPFSSRNLNGTYTRQFGGSVTNEFKAAWQKLSVLFGGCTTIGTDPLKGCIPNPTTDIGKSFTNVSFNFVGAAGTALQSVGPATNVPQGRQVRVAQFADNLSWVKGRHTMVMGVDYRNLNNAVPFLPNLNGAFRFPSPTRIVQNFPDRVIVGAGEPEITYKENDQFYYFQDDWKVKDNLTLNLGIRYEFTGQPINTLNKITTARESNPATALWRQDLPLSVRTVPFIPADKNNFAPRVGFAYSPRWGTGSFNKLLFGDSDATVIRGGYSIAYDPAFYNILLNVSTSAPTVFLNTINNTGTAAAPGFRLPANPTGDVVRSALGSFIQKNTFDPRFFSRTIVGNDFHSPYSQQWSFGVQRQFNRNNVGEIRYVGNRGVGLFTTVNRNPFIGRDDTAAGRAANGGLYNGFTVGGITFPSFRNLLPQGVTPLVCVDDPATLDNEGICNGRIQRAGLIRSRENTGFSNYHGLQTRYNGRLMNQLTVGLSYTFSKTIDTSSEIFAFGENAISKNPFDVTQGEKGLSGNDRRHASAMNVIWDVPYFKSQEGFAGHVLGGWQVNAVYILASGRPFTPSQIFNAFGFIPTYQDNGFGNSFFGFDSVRAFSGNPNAPRDTVGIHTIDAELIYGASPSPTGFYSLNALNNGIETPVTPADVRFIINLPGAAKFFNNPFGNIGRNSERGKALNQLNLGFFKNTKVFERVTVQFRAELFNALNHPNPGYGVAIESTLPDTFLEDAGALGSRFNVHKDQSLSSRRVQLGLRIIF
ncbi:MAG: TonB-dependent receptor [Acidobacteria bacterium]|nr:TonB-dependent receptor [Acidobacteriota bacterium]